MTTTPARSSDAASGTHPTNSSHTSGRHPSRIFGRWLLSFLGFPIGGYVAIVVVGPMDSTATALTGGALTGAVLGLAQAWAFGPTRPHVVTWVLATAVGLALGAAYGAAATDYASDVTSLVVLGAVIGMQIEIDARHPLGRLTPELTPCEDE